MAEPKQRTELLVGIFIFTGLLLLTWLILVIGSQGEKFDSVYQVEVAFEDASGVGKGTPVKLAGAPVGSVAADPVLEMGINPKVLVPIEINSRRRLPTNAVFRIESATVLGDKVIVIKIPKNPTVELLAQGDRIAGGQPGGLDALQQDAVAVADEARLMMGSARTSLAKFDLALDDIQSVTSQLNESVTRLNDGLLSERTLSSVQRTLANVEDASLGARNAAGELKPLLADARVTMTKINSLTERAEGTFGTLDRELANVGPALQGAPETLRSIRRTADKAEGAVVEAEKTFAKASETLDTLNSDDGLLGTLTSDGSVSTDTKTFVRNLRRYGILGYKDEETDEDDPRERYRGRRR